ncbi:hypothetical protein HMPREF9078_01308 [Capnocytophaga sp. oral taxon 380 str. F0488]|nr:hypothetical protein HMPREF9078_01308 [Capnocytophaga sp. oral taxon 380 str. F0488]
MERLGVIGGKRKISKEVEGNFEEKRLLGGGRVFDEKRLLDGGF